MAMLVVDDSSLPVPVDSQAKAVGLV